MTPRDEYMPAYAWGYYVLQHNARFHPASSRSICEATH